MLQITAIPVREKHKEAYGELTFIRLGIWEDKRFLNSSLFSVGDLSAEAEWNWLTSVSMALSSSEYWEKLKAKRKKTTKEKAR